MALGFECVLPRDYSSIPISAIFGPTFRLSSSQKFAALCYNWNQHCRAQPPRWLYTSTKWCWTCTWALKAVDLSRTTRWRWHPCWLLLKRVDIHRGNLLLARGPKVYSLYPLYVTLREGDLFLVDILFHLYGMDDSNTSTRPTSRIYLELDTSPKSPSPITISASVVNMASRLQPHTGRHHQENWIHSIWSIQMRVDQRYVTLLVASPISSASLTTQLGKCGHTRPEPKVGCSRSSRNGSPWWRTSLTVLQKLKCLRSDNGGEYK